ncbi:MAG: cytochrome c biogenesis protein ResB [Byssovorax sp.]
MDLGRRLIDLLASLRLAIVMMVALAGACIAATILESRAGTAAAQDAFYGTPWFAALLGLIALNVLLSMILKWPWKADQAGFVLAHVGIVVLLAGSLISTRYGLDGSMALVEGGGPAHAVRLPQRALSVDLEDGTRVRIPVPYEGQWWGEERHPLAEGLDLVLTRHQPHVAPHEHAAAAASGAPAIKYHFEGEFGREDGLLLAGDPERNAGAFGPVVLTLVAAAHAAEARAQLALPSGQPRAVFVAGPSGLQYALASRKGATVRGVAVVGRKIKTPWMDLSLVVDELLPHAQLDRHLLPEEPSSDAASRVPAVEARLEARGRAGESAWIAWNDGRRLEAPGATATVRFEDSAAPLPFAVALLDFESQKYPGTAMAATYQSRVRVDDPERGVSEHVVAMNRPLHYRGYTFFQSSFAEGERMTSVLAVSRAPGLPLVYFGTLVLTLGITWMFYGKPWLARRRGVRALAAHRRAQEVMG